ncbi:MAG TPA: outer membrane protein transport protein [Longimicrobiaceae bacterium]|nr:outer membrane protein transport protein [Longimicrobiaceae bacterium]
MRRSLAVAGIAFTATLAATAARAQGSGVMTHSSCATAVGAAGVARPCEDGSAILFNPGAVAMQRSVIGAGWTGISTGAAFTYDYTGEEVERDRETASVPFGFASFRLGERFAAGVGAFAPYGLGITWPMSFEGRFVSYDTKLHNIYIQPTLAFQAAPWLFVGAGLDVVRSSIEINQRLDLSTLPVRGNPFTFAALGVPSSTDFADVHLTGDGNGVTFNVGAVAEMSDRISVGVRYMHRAEIDFEGDAVFSQVPTGLRLAAGNPLGAPAGTPLDAVLQSQFAGTGALVNGGITTAVTLPAQLVVGASFRPLPNLELLGDYQWTSWEDFDQAVIDFARIESQDQTLILDYQDTHTVRLGGELDATEALALRAGFVYNTAAEKSASVSPFLPEAERNYYSVGLGYRLPVGLGIDAAYQLIDQADRRGRVRGRSSLDQTADQLNVGVYHADASVFNVTLSYRFGGQGR